MNEWKQRKQIKEAFTSYLKFSYLFLNVKVEYKITLSLVAFYMRSGDLTFKKWE